MCIYIYIYDIIIISSSSSSSSMVSYSFRPPAFLTPRSSEARGDPMVVLVLPLINVYVYIYIYIYIYVYDIICSSSSSSSIRKIRSLTRTMSIPMFFQTGSDPTLGKSFGEQEYPNIV